MESYPYGWSRGSPTTESMVILSQFHSSTLICWCSLAGLWCSAFLCWHVQQRETKSATSLFKPSHHQYKRFKSWYKCFRSCPATVVLAPSLQRPKRKNREVVSVVCRCSAGLWACYCIPPLQQWPAVATPLKLRENTFLACSLVPSQISTISHDFWPYLPHPNIIKLPKHPKQVIFKIHSQIISFPYQILALFPKIRHRL